MRKLGKIIAVLAGVISLTLAAPQSYAATALNPSSCTDANVMAGLGTMETAFAAKDTTTIGNIVDTNYLNKAENKTAFMAKLTNTGQTGLFDQVSSVKASYSSVMCLPRTNNGVTVAGQEDVFAFETMTWIIGGVTSSQINHKHMILKAVNGTNGTAGWTLYGNQKNWGVHFGTGNHSDPALPANNGTWLYVHVDDPTGVVSNVTITGPGVSGTQPLYHDVSGAGWDNWNTTNNTDIFSASTLGSYTLAITDNTGTTSKTLVYNSTLNTNFPTSLSPNGAYTASTPPIINWAAPAAGQYAYLVYLNDLSTGAQLWSSSNNIFGNTYTNTNSTPLVSGSCYNYTVSALDINENIAETVGHLGANTTSCLPSSLQGSVPSYAGAYSGSLSGSTTGAWAATISSTGSIGLTGYKTSSSGAGVISGAGQVFVDGAFTIYSTSGSTWNGSVNPSTGTLSGSWSSPNGNSGFVTGVAVNTAVTDPLLGVWSGTFTDPSSIVWNRTFTVSNNLTWSIADVSLDGTKACTSRGTYAYTYTGTNLTGISATVGSTVATGGVTCSNTSGMVKQFQTAWISGTTLTLGGSPLTLQNSTGTHSANGTYTWTPATSSTPASITWSWISSDLSCGGPSLGISNGTQTFSGVGISATTMIWPGSLTWTRSSGVVGDITGIWSATNATTGNTFTLTVNANGMSLSANIASCTGTNPPGVGTYGALGTSSWNVTPNQFDFTITASNFVGDSGPSFGLNTISGVSVTATSMTWPKSGSNNGDLVWTRTSGTGGTGVVEGTWTADGGNGIFTLTINADKTVNIIAAVTSPINVNYGTNTDSNGYHNFNIYINDSLATIQSAVLSAGPANTLGTGILMSSPQTCTGCSGLNWGINWSSGGAGTFNYTTFPTLAALAAAPYTLTIHYTNGVVRSQQITYSAFNTTYVSGLTPSGNYNGLTAPTFNWTIPNGQSGNGINMNEFSPQNNSWMNNIWSNWNLNGANSALYTGAMPLPACSQLNVSSTDANNNMSTLIQYLGSNLPSGQTCGANGITTASGYTVASGTDSLGGTWSTTVNSTGAMSIVIRETNGKIYSLTSQLTSGSFSTTGTVSISGTVSNTGVVSGSWTDSATSPATTATFNGNVVGSGSTSTPTPQTIHFGAAPTITVGGTGVVSATGGASGNAVIFSSLTPSVCTVSSNTVTDSIAGTCTIAATQAGNANYSSAPQATLNIIIGGTATGVNFDQMFIGRNKNLPGTGENFGVSLRFPRSVGDTLSSYSISCPGATTVTGTFSAVQANGSVWGNSVNYSTQPTTPFDCTATVTYANNTSNTATATVDRFIAATAYVTAVSPAANANLTLFNTISWTNPTTGPATGSYTYQSNLFSMTNGNLVSQLWFTGGVTGSPITYTGPTLVTNTPYEFAVATIEGAGTNKFYAAQTFVPFCYNCTATSYTASGTYSLDSVNNAVTFNWTTSNFVGCDGPSVGSKIQTGLVVTATSMSWANDTMTWTRSTGTAGDIKGTWTGTDPSTGNVYTLIINADGSISGSANIVMPSSCASNGGNGGSAAKAEAQHWASGYTVQLRYSDSSQTATAVSVTGPGITNSVALIYNTAMGSWGSGNTGSQISYGTSVPTGLPYNYTFTITGASGTTPTTATSTVSCFESQFVSNISPAGTGTVTGTPTFSWTGISDSSAVYGVQVNDSNGNWVWANYNISGTSIVYNGPSLTPGANYGYVVSVQSSSACSNPTSGGGSYVAGNFTVANGAVGGSYVGTYTGTYTGTASGTWTATVAQDGTVTATVIVSLLGQVSATGHVVLSSGALTITTTGAVGAVATFTGTIDANTGGVTGTWAGFTSDSGSFVGNSANHSGSAGSNIQLQMRTDQGPGGVMGPRQHVNLDVNQIPGTVSSVSVSGPGIANSLVLTKGPARIVSGVTYDSFFGGFDPSSTITNGAVYTFTVTPVGGGAATSTTQTYTGTAVTNTTTGAITITSPTGYALTSASLGSPLAVQWTLPTAYTIAQVKMGGYVQTSALGSNSGYQCWFDGPTLSATATSGSMTLPTTCGPNNDAVVQAGVNVSTIGTNGESSLIIYQFSGTATSTQAQAITFGAVPTVIVGGTGTLSATGGGSNNPVTFTTTSSTSICTLSGANSTTVTVNGVGAGTCTIAANQAGNSTYSPAPQVTQNITVTGGGATGTGTMLTIAPSWNLVGNSGSLPLTVATVLPISTTSNVSTVWKWIAATSKWAFYTPLQSDGGQAYALSKGYDFLVTIDGGEGFWVNSNVGTSFTVPLPSGGNPISSTQFADQLSPLTNHLPKGWSLISIGDNRSPSGFATVLSTSQPTQGTVPLSIVSLWAWDNSKLKWYFYAPDLDNAKTLANYISSKQYLDFSATPVKALDPSTGFWVNHP